MEGGCFVSFFCFYCLSNKQAWKKACAKLDASRNQSLDWSPYFRACG